jgi:hypothetical protein
MATPTVAELTETTVGGDGVFDQVMCATMAHIDSQYRQGRLTGPEYATVYVSANQVAWGTALQFLLQRDQAALTQAQIALAEQQQDLVAQQILLAQKEVIIAERNITKLDKEILIASKQLEIMEVEKGKVDAERLNIIANTANVPKQGLLIDKQKDMITAEILNVPKQGLLIDEQKAKTSAEKDVLIAKKKTEQAQTDGLQFNATSVIGKQTALYQGQIDAYKSDKIQKGAKIFADSFGVRLATDTAIPSANNKLDDDFIGAAIQKLINDMG